MAQFTAEDAGDGQFVLYNVEADTCIFTWPFGTPRATTGQLVYAPRDRCGITGVQFIAEDAGNGRFKLTDASKELYPFLPTTPNGFDGEFVNDDIVWSQDAVVEVEFVCE